MKKFKENNGITLIALVITIIILLILAGITIGSLTGEKGLIKEARTAKELAEKASLEEQVELAIVKAEQKYRNPGIDDVIEEIKANKVISNNDQVNKETGAIRTDAGYEITGKLDDYLGKVSGGEDIPITPEEIQITASSIANSSDKSEFYGATVTGYTCPNQEGIDAWRIFYADENNIYLIASTYVEYNFLPVSRYGSKLKWGVSLSSDPDHHHALSMENVIADYSGASDITDVRTRALNSNYFAKGYTTSYNNMKAVAFMLDTSVWNVFSGASADYAIGGPSIEMLVKSYSQKHHVDYRVSLRDNNNAGYYIVRDNATMNDTYSISSWLDSSDDLYCTQKGTASAMWISSPNGYGFSIEDYNYLYHVMNNGTVSNRHYTAYNETGFRPVVCLNTNTKLIKKSNGVFAIV